MNSITKEFIAGVWTHEEWNFELTMFNFLVIEWPNSSKAFGAWTIRNNEIILSYVYEGKRDRQIYIFSIEEIIDENTIKTKDIEKNKEEIMKRTIL